MAVRPRIRRRNRRVILLPTAAARRGEHAEPYADSARGRFGTNRLPPHVRSRGDRDAARSDVRSHFKDRVEEAMKTLGRGLPL